MWIKFKHDVVANYATYLAGVEYVVFESYYTPKGDVCGVDLSQEEDVYDHVHLLDKQWHIVEVQNV